MATVRLPLSSRKYPGLYALIDAEDFERASRYVWTPHLRKRSRYAMTRINRKTVYLHRFLMGEPEGREVDHVNGDGLDCRKANLRVATRAQNAWNTKVGGDGRSGFIGVWLRPSGLWAGEVKVQGTKYTAGSFATPEEAARARDRLAYALRGEFAVLNFPEEAENAKRAMEAGEPLYAMNKKRGREPRRW